MMAARLIHAEEFIMISEMHRPHSSSLHHAR